MPKIYRSLTIVFALWLLVWLSLSWPAMQDDAFIHLRYAVNLLQHHMISYDGVRPDYGTSSLFYVFVLAALRRLFLTPLLPRVVSSVFHLILFAGLVVAFARSLGKVPKLAQKFALLLLAFLVAPMAVRWLDDGMETSLALCLVALLAFSTSRLCHSETISNRSVVWLFLLGLVVALTRVEFLLLLGVAALTVFSSRFYLLREVTSSSVRKARFRLAMRCAAPLFGGLAAAAIILFTMHALIPDTAIAKGGNESAWLGTLGAAFSVLVSSLSFGILLMFFWLLTVAAVIAYKHRVSFPILFANSCFPITLILAAMRGQQVQGIRYFVWTLLFPILWNILELRWAPRPPTPSTARLLRWSTYALAVIFVLLLPVESTLLYKEFRTRAHSLAEFRSQHLERLSGLQLTAFDVGYIGYFTGSPLCDMAGLVNGRARARLPFPERVNLCLAEHPPYAFVSQFSLDELSHRIDMKDWSICSTYDLANLRSSDWHYLVASPAAMPEVCAATGNPPQPLKPLLQAGSK
jgi:hypothetical protein